MVFRKLCCWRFGENYKYRIAEESWFDDDVTPALFRDELNAGTGNITVWINSPGEGVLIIVREYYPT